MTKLTKIISGGQCGADIAGVDAAIFCNFPYGGWLPKGRKTENGPVPETYKDFQVMPKGGYPMRTEQNVKDADGTVIFTYGSLSGGSSVTKGFCLKNKKPWLHIDLNTVKNPAAKLTDWVVEWDIKTLNVAGNREKKSPGIYDSVKSIILEILNGKI